MRELTASETRETAGGIVPIVAAVLVSMLGSCTYHRISKPREDNENETE